MNEMGLLDVDLYRMSAQVLCFGDRYLFITTYNEHLCINQN